MINNINFRIATLDDLEQLVQLRIFMQLEVNSFPKEKVTDEYQNRVRSYFLKAIPGKKYFAIVAEKEGKIVGNAGACFYQKPPSISGKSGLVGYVTNVYTDTGYRRKGVGTNMMNELKNLAIALGADKLHLGATEDGVNIYKSVGFKKPSFVNLEIEL